MRIESVGRVTWGRVQESIRSQGQASRVLNGGWVKLFDKGTGCLVILENSTGVSASNEHVCRNSGGSQQQASYPPRSANLFHSRPPISSGKSAANLSAHGGVRFSLYLFKRAAVNAPFF